MPTQKQCLPGFFPDPNDPTRCLPFSVLIGRKVTIIQGADCWPKEIKIRPNPAIKGMIVAAIQREMRGTTQAALSRKVNAAPGLAKRIRTARARKPK